MPKKIYFYWGNNTMSWMRYMTLYSFRICNPDWKMIMYVSSPKIKHKVWKMKNYQDFFCYNGNNYMPKIKELDVEICSFQHNTDMTPSHASNFLKWDILSRKGGIYSDMDILWFRPIDKFYDRMKNYDTAICQTDILSIGLLASSGNNKFFKDILERACIIFDKTRYQVAGIEAIYSLYDCPKNDVLKIAAARYPQLRFYNIPYSLIYPYGSKNVEEVFSGRINGLPKDTIGYHWYAAHRISQEFNNILTEKTFKNYKTLFSKIVSDYKLV